MEGYRTPMQSQVRGAVALAAALVAVLTAVPAAATAAPASRPAAAEAPAQPQPARSEGAAPAAAADQAVQDKFRKFQEEMAQEGAASGTGGEGDSAPAPAPEPRGVASMAFQILLGLAFVLFLAVASIRLLKRFQGRLLSRPGSPSGSDILEVLETCHLGQNQRVVALRIHDEVGVIGVTPHGISVLATLKQPADEIRKLKLGPGNSAAFSDNLNRLLDRFKKPKRVSDLLDEA